MQYPDVLHSIEDHLLTKRNGHWRPNNRDHYRFGHSLPVTEKDLSAQVKRLITDLSKHAGSGPICAHANSTAHICILKTNRRKDIITHSADASHIDLGKKLGLDASGWERRLKPSGWEFASYASPDGIGKTFVLVSAHPSLLEVLTDP